MLGTNCNTCVHRPIGHIFGYTLIAKDRKAFPPCNASNASSLHVSDIFSSNAADFQKPEFAIAQSVYIKVKARTSQMLSMDYNKSLARAHVQVLNTNSSAFFPLLCVDIQTCTGHSSLESRC